MSLTSSACNSLHRLLANKPKNEEAMHSWHQEISSQLSVLIDANGDLKMKSKDGASLMNDIYESKLTSKDIELLKAELPKLNNFLIHFGKNAGAKINVKHLTELQTALSDDSQTQQLDPAKELLDSTKHAGEKALTSDLVTLKKQLSMLSEVAERCENLGTEQSEDLAMNLFENRRKICEAIYTKADRLLDNMKSETFMKQIYANPNATKKFQSELKDVAQRCLLIDSKDANNISKALDRASEKMASVALEMQKRQVQVQESRNKVITSPHRVLTKQSRLVQLFQNKPEAKNESSKKLPPTGIKPKSST